MKDEPCDSLKSGRGRAGQDRTTDYDIREGLCRESRPDLGRNAREVLGRAHRSSRGSWNPTRFDDVREMAKMTDVLSSRQVLVMPPRRVRQRCLATSR